MSMEKLMYSGFYSRSPTDIYHHGISGQQWGVRNGPPYPLSRQSGRRTSSSMKAGLSMKNKRVLLDTQLRNKVNPGFPKKKGSTTNCVLVSMACEMQRRGLDYRANTTEPIDTQNISRYFKTNESSYRQLYYPLSVNPTKKLRASLDSYGEQSSGVLGVTYKNTNVGHCVYWEKGKNGLKIIDGQNGRSYEDSATQGKSLEVFAKDYGISFSNPNAFAMRLDNADLNMSNIKKDSPLLPKSAKSNPPYKPYYN